MQSAVRLCIGGLFGFIFLFSCFQAALAAPCPQAEFFAGSLGNDYLADFATTDPTAGVVDVTFYTATRSYSASLPIAIGERRAGLFRSKLYSIVKLTAEPLLDAEMKFSPSNGEVPCRSTYAISQVTRNVTVIPEDSTIGGAIGLTFVRPEPVLSCDKPYANARVVEAARLQAPQPYSSRFGVVKVFVDVAPDASIYRAAIAESSGYADFDQAAMDAATQSKYAAARFRCEPIEGTFVFVADFQSQ